MPYPNIILTRPVRVFIMVFLIVSFCIVSPIVILYTAGYRYDWENNTIKQTGVISVDVEPTDANIYLNDVKIDKDIPARLSNRAPGTYHISLKQKGYKTWSKDITVESKKTTYINNITLLKDQLPIHLDDFKSDNIVDFYPSESSNYAIILKNIEGVYEVELLNLENTETTLLTRINKKPKIEWSKTSPTGVILTQNNNNYQAQLFSAATEDIGKKFTFNNQNYHWQENNNQAYFQDNNDIYQIGLESKNLIKTKENLSDVWYIDNNDNLWTFDRENNRLLKNDKIQENFDYDLKNILNITNNRILAFSQKHDLVAITLNNNQIQNTKKIEADKYHILNNDEVLAWSPWELWKIDQNGNTQLMNRTSEYIKDIKQMSENNLTLIHTKENLKTFNTHYFVTQHLFKNGKIKKTAIDQENRAVFLWGEIGKRKGLFKLNY